MATPERAGTSHQRSSPSADVPLVRDPVGGTGQADERRRPRAGARGSAGHGGSALRPGSARQGEHAGHGTVPSPDVASAVYRNQTREYKFSKSVIPKHGRSLLWNRTVAPPSEPFPGTSRHLYGFRVGREWMAPRWQSRRTRRRAEATSAGRGCRGRAPATLNRRGLSLWVPRRSGARPPSTGSPGLDRARRSARGACGSPLLLARLGWEFYRGCRVWRAPRRGPRDHARGAARPVLANARAIGRARVAIRQAPALCPRRDRVGIQRRRSHTTGPCLSGTAVVHT